MVLAGAGLETSSGARGPAPVPGSLLGAAAEPPLPLLATFSHFQCHFSRAVSNYGLITPMLFSRIF